MDKLTREREQIAFKAVAKRTEEKIDQQMQLEINLARAAGAYIGSNDGITEPQFQEFLNRQGWPVENTAVGGIGFSVRVPKADLQELYALAKAAKVKSFRAQPLPELGFIDAVLFVAPLPVNHPLGRNFYSESERRSAMDLAASSGKPIVTGKLHLFVDSPSKPAVVVLVPVFKKTRDDKNSLYGFAYASIRLQEAFDPVFNPRLLPECVVSIYDGPRPDSSNLLFSSHSGRDGRDFYFQDQYSILGRKWTISFWSTPVFDHSTGSLFLYLLAALGVGTSLALSYISIGQVQAKESAERDAIEAEQRAGAQELLAGVGSILASPEESGAKLQPLADLIVQKFSDYCIVALDRGAKQFSFDIQARRTIINALPESAFQASPLVQAVLNAFQNGQASWAPGQRPSLVAQDEAATYLRTLGVGSFIMAPVAVRDQKYGVLVFLSGIPSRPYSATDVHLATEIAFKAALAIENSQLVAALNEELSERKRAESLVRQLNEELEDLVDVRTRDLKNAMEELEAFCYSVSHDLRSPLRSVDGFSKALLEEYGDRLDEDAIGYIDRVRRASSKMDELITSLLNLSRLTRAPISLQELDLSEIASQVASELDPKNTVEFDIEPNMKLVGDDGMIRVLMDNLIANAIKFTGKVEHPVVQIGTEPDGSFFVQDNGAGFNPAYANKLFQPFERLHSNREFPGSGIGLATAARIVRRHGGVISGTSTEGHGARFTFSILN